MLDNIQDPGNLGTIIRTADWFGIKQLLCSRDCVDYLSPKTLQSSMGSFLRVSVVYTDILDIVNEFADCCYAATTGGENVRLLNNITEAVLIIGNEGKGIRDEILKRCKKQVRIPGTGNAESLNAAVSAAILCDRFSEMISRI
jgi:TrmH family RNA methyltransferase